MAVDEHNPAAPEAFEGKRVEFDVAGTRCRGECLPRNWRHVCVAPLFEVPGGKAERFELRECIAGNRRKPTAAALRIEVRELRLVVTHV